MKSQVYAKRLYRAAISPGDAERACERTTFLFQLPVQHCLPRGPQRWAMMAQRGKKSCHDPPAVFVTLCSSSRKNTASVAVSEAADAVHHDFSTPADEESSLWESSMLWCQKEQKLQAPRFNAAGVYLQCCRLPASCLLLSGTKANVSL